jgi:hypothetical protein
MTYPPIAPRTEPTVQRVAALIQSREDYATMAMRRTSADRKDRRLGDGNQEESRERLLRVGPVHRPVVEGTVPARRRREGAHDRVRRSGGGRAVGFGCRCGHPREVT